MTSGASSGGRGSSHCPVCSASYDGAGGCVYSVGSGSVGIGGDLILSAGLSSENGGNKSGGDVSITSGRGTGDGSSSGEVLVGRSVFSEVAV